MKKYKNVIIGFGKAGKTLAGICAKNGETTCLIEKNEKRYGGTCINVACIPSKSLENSARLSNLQGGNFEERQIRYELAIEKKNNLTAMLREKNYEKLKMAGVEILNATATFINKKTINIEKSNGENEIIEGERFFINTGSETIIPDIEGLKTSKFVYTSETMMELKKLPQRLVIIGGGYIGLEFASYYTNFGSKVTIIDQGKEFIPKEDREMANTVLENFKNRGITVLFETKVSKIIDGKEEAIIKIERDEKTEELSADAILVAIGRKASTNDLKLENAEIELTERKAIKVDKNLKTSVENIWAMGDVTGGLQFTYISLDDCRIVKSQIYGNNERNTENRKQIPYSVFIDPVFSRTGITEEEAKNKGINYKVAKIQARTIPKAQVLEKPEGMLKVIIDGKTGMILGAHLFCIESQEMINLIKLAMDNNIPYEELRDNIYNHPTMTEAFNDLFSNIL